MIGRLPTSLTVNGKEIPIRTDFRDILLILTAYDDPELTDEEKCITMLRCLYDEPITTDDVQEAITMGIWFIDGGKNSTSMSMQPKKTMDWEQDEAIIFSAINKVAGFETREREYLHWWTFLGHYMEIGEGLFSTVIAIRHKRNKGKKLEKHELEFEQSNKEMVKLKVKYSEEEEEEIARIKELLK
jgi:hypothetical protein